MISIESFPEREATPGQTGNYDVVSMEEAWQLVSEAITQVA